MQDTIAKLGPIMQLAFVPRDVPAALRHWTEVIGAGPFFSMPHLEYVSAHYRGADARIDFSVFIGYWGDIQIELIQQHCETPSIYKAWLDDGHEGLHHVCLLVDDMDAARAVVAQAGLAEEQGIVLDGGEAIYVDTGGGPGTMVEILVPMPGFDGFCTMMREAHRDWDGQDPIRGLG